MPPRVSPNDEPDKLDSEPKSTPSVTGAAAADPGNQAPAPAEDDDAAPVE